jgi:hypothetical protein
MSQQTGIQRYALPKWEARAAAGGLAIGAVGATLGVTVVRRRIVYSVTMLAVIVLYVAGAGVL